MPQMSSRVFSCSLPRTTRERNAVYTLSPEPVATLHRTVRPHHLESTPARSHHPAQLPLAVRPKLPLPLGPIGPLPSSADSGSSSLAQHSRPPLPHSTRCPNPEIPSAWHCNRMSAALL